MAAETAISFGQEQEVPRGKWEREKHFPQRSWGSLRIPKMKRQAATQKTTPFCPRSHPSVPPTTSIKSQAPQYLRLIYQQFVCCERWKFLTCGARQVAIESARGSRNCEKGDSGIYIYIIYKSPHGPRTTENSRRWPQFVLVNIKIPCKLNR